MPDPPVLAANREYAFETSFAKRFKAPKLSPPPEGPGPLPDSVSALRKPCVCDPDGDGVFTTHDIAVAVQQILEGNKQGCDVDGNGRVDVADLQRIIDAVTLGVCRQGR
jgi:hypothetical protein